MQWHTIGMKPVQKIFGPGNAFVTEAKRQVFGTVGIDGLNGPSEICIIADEAADPKYVMADLASQLEHGPDSKAWLLTTSSELARVCEAEGVDIRIYSTLEECISSANELAPEHLELLVMDPMRLIDMVEMPELLHGPYSPVPAGDYFLGVNHILPTGGSAVFIRTDSMGLHEENIRGIHRKRRIHEIQEVRHGTGFD
ncbi:MAG: histidinol dehydrogenase [Thermoplasmatales archaeon Gpl]|nr:MAG: histidinol dehydrogenase [Thermoplasmatales archaeon Gpl]